MKIYDGHRCVEIIIQEYGDTYDEACDFFHAEALPYRSDYETYIVPDVDECIEAAQRESPDKEVRVIEKETDDSELEMTAASFYGGGWRAVDREEMAQEYLLTDREADRICEHFAVFAEREKAKEA